MFRFLQGPIKMGIGSGQNPSGEVATIWQEHQFAHRLPEGIQAFFNFSQMLMRKWFVPRYVIVPPAKMGSVRKPDSCAGAARNGVDMDIIAQQPCFRQRQ